MILEGGWYPVLAPLRKYRWEPSFVRSNRATPIMTVLCIRWHRLPINHVLNGIVIEVTWLGRPTWMVALFHISTPHISTWCSHKITVVQPTQITVWEPAQSISTRLISLSSRKLHETLDVPDSLFVLKKCEACCRNMSQPFFSKWLQLSIWLSVTSQVRFVWFCAMEHWPRSAIVFLGCIGVSYLLWACAAFCWSKSYYQTNINGLPWLTLWFNAHWVEFPILLLVLDLYQIWDGSPFKPISF